MPQVLADPVTLLAVTRGQYPFASLQADAVTAFKAFENLLGALAPAFDDLGQLFDEGFWHR
ncbi:MAG: hypothetical protein KBA32_15775 [Propionivibrio sp.]|uniref:hypothetical protein n=1 Tax=Propionivibrio sp. TaxID=2212460 RepID=UPI001B5A9CFF|nr:hypothetical protein [Propionivibrio sp.]MBP7204645.1 hypothetical protein [Propionivibrio sp.]